MNDMCEHGGKDGFEKYSSSTTSHMQAWNESSRRGLQAVEISYSKNACVSRMVCKSILECVPCEEVRISGRSGRSDGL